VADILSQLPGIFYRSPSPDKPAYANPGDAITVGQAIGIVEIISIEDAGTVDPGDVIATITGA
jgi:biotin carboxyl carrier protein